MVWTFRGDVTERVGMGMALRSSAAPRKMSRYGVELKLPELL